MDELFEEEGKIGEKDEREEKCQTRLLLTEKRQKTSPSGHWKPLDAIHWRANTMDTRCSRSDEQLHIDDKNRNQRYEDCEQGSEWRSRKFSQQSDNFILRGPKAIEIEMETRIDTDQQNSSHKNSTGTMEMQSVVRRKLSESRGVKLPEIRIVQNPSTFVKARNGAEKETTCETVDEVDLKCPRGDCGQPTDSVDGRVPRQNASPATTVSPISQFIRKNRQSTPPSTVKTRSPGSIEAVINICIFLPDNRGIQFSVEGGRMASAQDLIQFVCEHLNIPLELTVHVFALWMMSPLLEVQLKPHHIAVEVRRNWPGLLRKFTSASREQVDMDEPLLIFRRNVLLTIEKEAQLAYGHDKATEMLFLDARDQVLSGRYVCSRQEALDLAAIDMTLSRGAYSPETHTLQYIRDVASEFVAAEHVTAVRGLWLLGWPCGQSERCLIDRLERLANDRPPPHSLRIRYLNRISSTPFYGAAFFAGQMERRKLWHLVKTSDLTVLVGISRRCITVTDTNKHSLLLTLPVSECSSIKVDSPDETNPDVLPSFLLHFADVEDAESGFRSNNSKLLQIFSKQAVMMEALLNAVCNSNRLESIADNELEETEQTNETQDVKEEKRARKACNRRAVEQSTIVPTIRKLSQLCLATFDASGVCLQVQGSLRKVLDEP